MQAYLGSSTTSYDWAKTKAEDLFKNFEVSESITSKLNYIFEVENVPDAALKEETSSLIKEFLSNPKQVVHKLILLQEICLLRKVVPENNLFDDEEAFDKASFGFEKSLIKKLLVQTLRFC